VGYDFEEKDSNQTPTETEDTHIQLRCSHHCLRRLDVVTAMAASEPIIQNLDVAAAILREVVAHG